MYRFEQEPSGILTMVSSGFWDVGVATAYITDLQRRVDAIRRHNGNVLFLADGRESQVQSAEVMRVVGDIESILIRGPHDRAAYIVPNSLAKLQARRLASSERLEIFLSPSAARTWLLAYADQNA